MDSELTSRIFMLSCLVFILNTYIVIPEVDALTLGSTNLYSNTTRIKRQNKPQANKKCNGFKCASSNECIPEEQRCDGVVDCKDGSDEFNDCKTISCPKYLFSCEYGACIDMDKKCNGQKDCRDNSDETNCLETTKVSENVGGNCNSNQFECKSGQCIPFEEKCDGFYNCEDHSDEIKDTCLNIRCPGYTFKCDYGACINGYGKCDGVKDCVDNSDEEDCGKPVTDPPVLPPVVPSTGGCVLPDYPENGLWNVLGRSGFQPGQRVAISTLVTFSCNSGYKLSNKIYLACFEDGWSHPPPTCSALCPAVYTDVTTIVRCYDQDKTEVLCSSASDNTILQVECAAYYELSDRLGVIRYCKNGNWNLPPPKCIPVCGEKVVSAVPLVVNGKNVVRGNYPWVVAIYQNLAGNWTNICGGSMLTQKVILTAAHCVSTESGQPLNTLDYKIAVGKYYNRYQDERDTEAQYSDVSSIEVHGKYRGASQHYASDIAFIITTDKILFSKVVQPVCSHGLAFFPLKKGMVGVVSGWGYTKAGGTPSDELKEIDVPYKDEAQCSQELPAEWYDRYAATYDKFCAGYANQSTAVCNGDSGGALVFKNKDDRYYVQGVVSLARKITDGCDLQASGLYTKVSVHSDFLNLIIAKYSS